MMIFMTLSLFFLFSCIGLSVDLGYSYFIKVFAQAAADSAALAAASYASTNGAVCTTNVACNSTYSCPASLTTATTAFQAGCLYAQANGFVNTGNQSVSFIANNTSAPNETLTTTGLWIQANVAQTVSHLFLYMSGFHSGSVAAQSVAGVTGSPNSSCVFVLSPSAADAVSVTGNSFLTTSGCGVNVKSNSSTAINVTGSSAIKATSGGQLSVVGTANCASFPSGGGNGCSPTPVTVATVTDPLAGKLTAPTVPTTCGQTNYNPTGSPTINPTYTPAGVLSSGGVYCGGITVGGVAHLTMNPGIYIMNGGGFNIGASGTVTGSGVTIFLTGQNGYVAAGMQLSGSAVTTLSAPTSGPYQGILFYQDPGATYGAGNAQSASAVLNATGTFYFPTTSLTLSGNVSASKIAIIAWTLTIAGSSTFNEDTSGAFTGTALQTQTPGLIE